MEFKQGNIAEIVESEHIALTTAQERYGHYWAHAANVTLLLSSVVKSVGEQHELFSRFCSQAKKHHTLALFSTLRLHKVQAMMNLRQVLEAGASAIYAAAHPDPGHFAELDADGLLEASQKLTKKRYAWLAANFPDMSAWIQSRKNQINSTTAHSNVISTAHHFRRIEAEGRFDAPFFDIEDRYFVQTDLWLVGSIGISLMDFIYAISQRHPEIVLCDFFEQRIAVLVESDRAIQDELRATQRYQAAARRAGAVGSQTGPTPESD